MGASQDIHDAIQGLNAIRGKVDALRQLPNDETVASSIRWDEWQRELARTRNALRAVRDAAEAVDALLSEQSDVDKPSEVIPPRNLSILPEVR